MLASTRIDGDFVRARQLLADAEAGKGAWKVIKENKYGTMHKGKDGDCKQYAFITSPQARSGIPFTFCADVLQDDELLTADDSVLEYKELGNNSGGNVVELLALKMPTGVKNRELVTMSHERLAESAEDGGAQVYERISRSTTHSDRPIQFSTEDKVNNPNGIKRKFIRAYVFNYLKLTALDDGKSCEQKELTALDLRGDFPAKMMDTLMFEDSSSSGQALRKEIFKRMTAASYQPMPPEKIKMEKKKK